MSRPNLLAPLPASPISVPVVTSLASHGRPLRISVEGNIGSGKSTFLNYCRRHGDIDVACEPVDEWTNVDGFNLLVRSIFMLRSFRDAIQLTFSLHPFISICMTERSLLSSRFVLHSRWVSYSIIRVLVLLLL